jgi:phosphoribosyl 1,2-cyclic phosphodiesterase
VQAEQDARMTVRFWGVRGSIPSPGPQTCRYGGNTACVEVRAAGELLILDAGTGIRQLGLALNESGGPVRGTILISHAHWDHIHGLPFFAPAMAPGNRFQVYGCTGTPAHLRSILAGQMETPYFPVSLDDLPDTLEFHELPEDAIRVGPLTIRTMRLHHPGMALGFRIELGRRSLVYATDHEPTPAVNGGEPPLDSDLIRFASGADLLICDAQYTGEEYRRHVGWGHSSVTDAVRLALAAGVRQMALFHHDPERTDAALDALLAEAQAEIVRRGGTMDCIAATEGMELTL